MSEDIMSLLDYFAKPVVKELKRIADSLEDLSIYFKAIGINNQLKVENKQQEERDDKPLPVISEVDPLAGTIVKETKVITTEEVLMDLKEVTTIAHTAKAYLVTKKGLQKWLPISTIEGGDPEFEDGTYCDEIFLKTSGAWIMKKPWDKLEVRKK